MTCTFFGHRDCPGDIYESVYSQIIELIEKDNVDCFLVGEEGRFDRIVQRALYEIRKKRTNIFCFVVKAYYDPNKKEDLYSLESIYPDSLTDVPKRFAIDKRNQYMIERSQVVVVYVRTSIGGASKFMNEALRKNKKVINLASENTSS